MSKKILLGIVSLLILIIIAYLTTSIKPTPATENQAYIPPTEQIGTESPAAEENVTGQPAYIIDAYSKDSLNYIVVDYVELLHGKSSIEAQVEAGVCVNASECYDFPNGYKKNKSAHVRILEVSPFVSIEVESIIESLINGTMAEGISITFPQFRDAVSGMQFFYNENASFPFRPAKAFIIVDIKDNLVTKIIEPYQE